MKGSKMKWNHSKALATCCLMLPLLYNSAAAQTPAPQANNTFNQIVSSIRQEALSRGVSAPTVDRVLNNIQPVPGLRKLEYYQPESVKSYLDYHTSTVTAARIAKGRQLMAQHATTLAAIEKQYGVPANVIVAVWGMETNYGAVMGNNEIIPALVTLAEIGKNDKRRAYFREEAILAMKIMDEGYSQIVTRKGSWAGAFGQTQFMPSSFLKFARDGDGDGRKDVWNNVADAFASTANYLSSHGWKTGERWGRAVQLPAGFDKALLTDKLADQTLKTPDQWKALGVKMPNGTALPADNTMQAMMIAPDGLNGPAFMVYHNFKMIMRYNSSYKYALSVSRLAEAISAGQPAAMPQPGGLNQ